MQKTGRTESLLKREGTKRSRDEMADERFTTSTETGIRKTAACKEKDKWQKPGSHLSKYKEKSEWLL
jgi:hypothetical protein